jgi:hypothetical protein
MDGATQARFTLSIDDRTLNLIILFHLAQKRVTRVHITAKVKKQIKCSVIPSAIKFFLTIAT